MSSILLKKCDDQSNSTSFKLVVSAALQAKVVSPLFLQETMLIDFGNAFLEGLSGDFISFAVNTTKAGDGLLRGRPRGGLAILCRKAYSHLKSFPFPSDKKLQLVCLRCDDQEHFLVNLYMPVCSSENSLEFSLYLGKLVSFLSDKYTYVCFLGDFNANYSTKNIFSHELKAVIAKNDSAC